MFVTRQEQQVKDEQYNLKEERGAHLNYVLNSCFKSITSPGSVSENVANFGSYLAISLIFFLDVITDPIISFYILCFFQSPLLHCIAREPA